MFTASPTRSDSESHLFPCEVWMNILSHASEDSATLASCMRVSTTMLELAGPYLYRTVHWGRGLRTKPHPLDVYAPSSDSERVEGLFKSKVELLSLMRVFQIHDHTAAECKGWAGLPLLEIPILRLTAANNGNVIGQKLRHLSFGTSSCLAIHNVAPRKLILDGVQAVMSSLPMKKMDQKSLSTLVQVLDLDTRKQAGTRVKYHQFRRRHDYEPSPPRAFHRSQASVKRAVFVVRSITPKNRTWFPLGLVSETLDGWLRCFCQNLAANAGQRDFANEIIIVNYPLLILTEKKLKVYMTGPHRVAGHDDKTLMKKMLEDCWREEISRIHSYWAMPEDRMVDQIPMKTLAETKKVIFKLETLAEYVENNDWEGEYHVSEVERLLAEIDEPSGDSECKIEHVRGHTKKEAGEEGLKEEEDARGDRGLEDPDVAQDWSSDEELDYSYQRCLPPDGSNQLHSLCQLSHYSTTDSFDHSSD